MIQEKEFSHSCLLCKTPTTKWFEKKRQWYFHCSHCHLVQLPAGVMLNDNGVSVYEDECTIFMQEGNAAYYLDESNFASARQKVNYVQQYISKGSRLLDAGANYGHFLKTAENIFDAVGFDISPQAVTWSQQNLNVRNRVASIYELPPDIGDPFDAITCWDTIEHLDDPLKALHQLWRIIKPGGYLFLSTPDIGSIIAHVMGRKWHYLDGVQHVVLFTSHTLKKALELTGFEVVKVCSFGHYYRLRYVFDRLCYLNSNGFLRWVAELGRKTPDYIQKYILYLKFGDVMGFVCKRK
jgi:SAM-dependent methyltransferase